MAITKEMENEDQGGKPPFRPLFCLGVSCFMPTSQDQDKQDGWTMTRNGSALAVCAKKPIRNQSAFGDQATNLINLKKKHTHKKNGTGDDLI